MLFDFFRSGDPLEALLSLLFVFGSLIVVISVHEFAHAFISFKLGDPTAKVMGRLTLNPLAHLDPVGTLLLLIAGFGWGKPVPFDPNYFANPRRDSALVSLAGPASNFLFAVLFAILYHVFPISLASVALKSLVYLNLILCFFNLIPIHPLDGFKVVWGILPARLSLQWMDLAPYGIYILLFMIFTNITDGLILAPASFFIKLLL